MARSISEWQQSITAIYVSAMADVGLTINPQVWSRVNLQRLFIFVFASSAFILESLFDALRLEIDAKIKELKPHSERWYAGKVKQYQHGFSLVPESDFYDNAGVSESALEASRVVKYAAVIEQMNAFGRVFLRIKLATEDGADLAPLSAEQLAGVREFMKRVKDAGVALQIDSLPPDNLKMQWDIRYDPLVLNGNGGRLDGTNSDPVGEAIRAYLKNLPFNGTFVLAYITDAVQKVEGVVIPTVTGAQVKYGNREYESIQVKYDPDAGYLRIYDPADLQITYIPQSVIQ